MKIILITLATVLLAFGCTKCNKYFGMSDDHPLEEIAEAIFEGKLGLPRGSVDFSPASPE